MFTGLRHVLSGRKILFMNDRSVVVNALDRYTGNVVSTLTEGCLGFTRSQSVDELQGSLTFY